MAGPGSDAATEDGLLKTTYEDVIAEGVLKKFQLRDAFKQKDSPWEGGRGKEWSAHVERNNSPMAVGSDSARDGEDLTEDRNRNFTWCFGAERQPYRAPHTR